MGKGGVKSHPPALAYWCCERSNVPGAVREVMYRILVGQFTCTVQKCINTLDVFMECFTMHHMCIAMPPLPGNTMKYYTTAKLLQRSNIRQTPIYCTDVLLCI